MLKRKEIKALKNRWETDSDLRDAIKQFLIAVKEFNGVFFETNRVQLNEESERRYEDFTEVFRSDAYTGYLEVNKLIGDFCPRVADDQRGELYDLRGADIASPMCGLLFEDCDLSYITLHFYGFLHCKMVNCVLRGVLHDGDFPGFCYEKCLLEDVVFRNANLGVGFFQNCQFCRCKFQKCILPLYVHMKDCVWEDCSFQDLGWANSILERCHFKNCSFPGGHVDDLRCRETIFEECNFYGVYKDILPPNGIFK